MKNLISILLFLLSVRNVCAQFENTDIGARATGLNGAFTSLANSSLAVFYNPSGLGQMKYREVSVFYSPSQFGLYELSSGALTYAEPLSFGTFGIGVRTFGFDLYRETNAILSYGNSYREKFFYGLNLNYYNLNIQNYNSASSFGADIGAMAYINSFLKWGIFVKNISGSTIGKSQEKLAQVYKTGFTIQPQNDLNLILEIEKDVKFPVSFRGGMEYSVNEFVDIRGGVGTEATSFSGGLSIFYNIFQFEYAIFNTKDLGITNQGSVTINFGGNTARKYARDQLQNAFQ